MCHILQEVLQRVSFLLISAEFMSPPDLFCPKQIGGLSFGETLIRFTWTDIGASSLSSTPPNWGVINTFGRVIIRTNERWGLFYVYRLKCD